MNSFSLSNDEVQNIGELVLETLLSYSVDSIIDLNLGFNSSWFSHPVTKEERSGNIDLLTELISRQTRLQILNLSKNLFSSNATQTLLTKIADVISNI